MTLRLLRQRVYGITFPDKKQLAEHLERLAEAKKRDHRVVGTQMELFMFDKLSPGSCFFMPNGACIYNALVEVRRAITSRQPASEGSSSNAPECRIHRRTNVLRTAYALDDATACVQH